MAPKTVHLRVAAALVSLPHHGIDPLSNQDRRRIRSKLPRGGAVTRRGEPTPEKRWTVADHPHERAKVLVLILASPGIRIGEAVKVRVSDLDPGASPAVSEIRAVNESIDLRRSRPPDTFQAIREPPNHWLAAALWRLDRHGAGLFARHAAIWITASDTRWVSSGSLLSGETLEPHASEDDAARVMVALDLDGVDITSRPIRADARGILAGGVSRPVGLA